MNLVGSWNRGGFSSYVAGMTALDFGPGKVTKLSTVLASGGNRTARTGRVKISAPGSSGKTGHFLRYRSEVVQRQGGEKGDQGGDQDLMATPKAALLGAGIFSKDVYAGIFAANTEVVSLACVWSRSAESSSSFCSVHAPGAQALHGDDGLESILADASITLVVVVLPVQCALQVVQRALAAGKHVIEEKPVAGTAEAALAAIRQYRLRLQKQDGAGPQPVWCLAENFRYEDVFHAAARLCPSLGTIIKLDLVADLPVDSRSKYYGSQWRRDTDGCPGGIIMESSVHFIAALRMVAASCGLGEAQSVSCSASHAKPDLSGPDSLVGVVRFAKGQAPASVSISLAASHAHWSLRVVGTNGTLEVSRGGWTGSRGEYVLSWKLASEAEPSFQKFAFSGIANEFRSFLRLINASERVTATAAAEPKTGEDEEDEEAVRASPEEGARDLALVQALMQSGAAGGAAISVLQI